MKREGPHHEAISQIVFDERYAVPTAQPARQSFVAPPRWAPDAEGRVDSMATACVIAVMESMCICALQPFIDARSETIVGAMIECRPWAPIASGSVLRVGGWVECITDDDGVKFHVQVQDEQERVCEA